MLEKYGVDAVFVGHWQPGIDVEHRGAGLDLGQGIAFDAAVITGRHFVGQQFAACWVDALADDDKRVFGTYEHLTRRRLEHCFGHMLTSSFASVECWSDFFDRVDPLPRRFPGPFLLADRP